MEGKKKKKEKQRALVFLWPESLVRREDRKHESQRTSATAGFSTVGWLEQLENGARWRQQSSAADQDVCQACLNDKLPLLSILAASSWL